jgi:hypothetical protein
MKKIIITEEQFSKLYKTLAQMSSSDFEFYRNKDNYELMEYVYIDKHKYHLPVTCYADDGGSFKLHGHPLWFYMCNSYKDVCDVLPLSICSDPQILVSGYKLKISQSDFEVVRSFIKKNADLIYTLGIGQISNADFLEDINDGEQMEGPRELLTESKLRRSETGLPVDIWVDENATYKKGGHAPRLKFQSIRGDNNSFHFSTVTISDNPKILNLPQNKGTVDNKELDQIRNFVRNNQQLLMDLSNGKISIMDFREHIHRC